MSETMHTLALEILKAKINLSETSNVEIHKAYREIYAELLKCEHDYALANPGSKLLK